MAKCVGEGLDDFNLAMKHWYLVLDGSIFIFNLKVIAQAWVEVHGTAPNFGF